MLWSSQAHVSQHRSLVQFSRLGHFLRSRHETCRLIVDIGILAVRQLKTPGHGCRWVDLWHAGFCCDSWLDLLAVQCKFGEGSLFLGSTMLTYASRDCRSRFPIPLRKFVVHCVLVLESGVQNDCRKSNVCSVHLVITLVKDLIKHPTSVPSSNMPSFVIMGHGRRWEIDACLPYVFGLK